VVTFPLALFAVMSYSSNVNLVVFVILLQVRKGNFDVLTCIITIILSSTLNNCNSMAKTVVFSL